MLTVGRLLRIIFRFLLVLIIGLILFINLSLHYSTRHVQQEVLHELHGIKNALNHHADVDMQNVYPEGYVFLNAIYGIAWSNFLKGVSSDSANYIEGHSEIQKAWNRINSDTARITFEKDLAIPYGAFYTGWNTYLLGRKLSLENSMEQDSLEVFLFKKQCALIAEALKSTLYPSSYSGQAWPADAMVCVAALSLHDKLFTAGYNEVISNWLYNVKRTVDKNRLIPHSVNKSTVKENARGSSLSLMLIFLRDIDPPFAIEQFTLYKKQFLDQRFGLTGIREYPAGIKGDGDIDSGPVLLEMGAVATIVGMHTLNLYGDSNHANLIQSEIETFGFPLSNPEKKYLLGQLPMADAFIVWGHSSVIEGGSDKFFVEFHIYSLMATAFLIVLLWLTHNNNYRIIFNRKK